MSRYVSIRRFAALAVCVGSTTAIALGAASPAVAATCVKASSKLYGSGSSFQGTSQTNLKKNWPAHSKCSEAPTSGTITYTATSSGKGLEVFGAGNLGGELVGELLNRKDTTVKALEEKSETCEPKINKAAATHEPSGKCLDVFVGTDDAPSVKLLENMTTGAVGKTFKSNGGVWEQKANRGAVVVPYGQGPLAVGFSLPAGCKVQNASKIYLPNAMLGQLFEGERAPSGADPGGVQAQGGYLKETWGALLTQLNYSKVAKESELAENKFTETATPEETLTRYEAGAGEEEVTVHSKTEIEKNENPGGKKVKVAHQKKEVVKGEGCNAKIKSQVRASESGTSFAFKSYLNQINPTVWAGLNTDGVTWPEKSNVITENTETSGKGKIKQEKGGQLAEAGAATPGSVNYQDTADAALKGGFGESIGSTTRPVPASSTLEEVVEEGEAENGTTKGKEKILTLKGQPVKSLPHQIAWAYIQDTGTKEPTKEGGGGFKHSEFEDPLVVGTTKANCQRSKLIAGDEAFPEHWNDSWNKVLASDPAINKVEPTAYPACAFTYDIAWHHYGNVELYGHTKIAEELAATVRDYFEYAASKLGGEELFNEGYYAGIPDAMRSHVLAGVKQIGF